MDAIAGVEFIQGDFASDEVLQQLLDLLGASPAACNVGYSPKHVRHG